MDQFENNGQKQVSPHKVDRKAIIIASVLFVLIVGGMFTFALLKKAEIQEEVIFDTF
ncbi:MAG: flagellar basal body-associated protein FliL [Acidimicrobiales bacterium]|jgi:flagellar basal body-associated protein FliL